MNKQQLKQVMYLKNEIILLEAQLYDLDGMTTVTDKVKGSSHEFPYTERSFTIEGADSNSNEFKIRHTRLKSKLLSKKNELLKIMEDAENFIDNVDDSLARTILRARYLKGYTWKQVATSIGGNNTPDSVRMTANKYLKNI